MRLRQAVCREGQGRDFSNPTLDYEPDDVDAEVAQLLGGDAGDSRRMRAAACSTLACSTGQEIDMRYWILGGV
jgi:hypothetical protein